MGKTYTYVARNASEPDQVATFTLYDKGLSIELGMPIGKHAVGASKKNSAAQLPTDWIKLAALLEELDHPIFDLADVAVGVEKDDLRLMAWCRSDHHWLPVMILIEHVDNPDGAPAFIKELNRRKLVALRRKRFLGSIGARPYWFLGGSLATLLALRSLRAKQRN